MATPIEDYALIGDCQTAALLSREGSIDWLCFPRFDSGACFASLLGDPDNGRWSLKPADPIRRITRRYRDATLILETEFETRDGAAVTVIDFMPPRTAEPDLVRIVAGRRGKARMEMELIIRSNYGSTVPWVRKTDGGITAVAGPDAYRVTTPVELRGENLHTVARFTVSEGETVPFVLAWYPSHEEPPGSMDPDEALERTGAWWRRWSERCSYDGEWRDPVLHSLMVLKALTYSPTGGIVAAPTTSLPEAPGGVRNWDYRYCWIRDATFTLHALMAGGYSREACAWRDWLVRALAGEPSQLQPLYGLAGERELTEREIGWLRGYRDSSPVRIGNQAHGQFQLDVFGELMDTMHMARRVGLAPDENAWRVQLALMERLDSVWDRPDNGIWEVRGPPRHFTHSKVMAWVAFDRAVKTVETFGLEGDAGSWKARRDEIHREICREGFDPELSSFVQAYGSKELDASLLLLPLVGFLPPHDSRIRGTVDAVARELLCDGLVRRYADTSGVDGLPPGEGAFLLCTFWLAENYALLGRRREARELFERLLDLRNDVGLLPEEYDVESGRFVGNFPQAFSHVALINSAQRLGSRQSPAERRSP